MLDIGETSYGSPLADDGRGPDRGGSLIVAAMSAGQRVSSSRPPTRRRILSERVDGPDARLEQRRGEGRRQHVRRARYRADVQGHAGYVHPRPFEILDARHLKSSKRGRGPYSVTVTATAPGFVRVVNATYDKPGRYVVTLDAPRGGRAERVSIRVSDRHELFAEDAYAVSFHAPFYRALKWLLALPFAAATAAVITLAQNEDISAHFATNAGLIGARDRREGFARTDVCVRTVEGLVGSA